MNIHSSQWSALRDIIKTHPNISKNNTVPYSSTNNIDVHVDSNGRILVKLYYNIVESLGPSYREFHAIYDLSTGIILKNDILGIVDPVLLRRDSSDIPTTPPQIEDDETFYYDHSNEEYVSGYVNGCSSSEEEEDDDEEVDGENECSEEVKLTYKELVNSNHNLGNLINSDNFSTNSINLSSDDFRGINKRYLEHLTSKFNSSQLHAITTSISQPGFTLIQGPPGSGKTSTILGILNSVHLREYHKYYEMLLSSSLSLEGKYCNEVLYNIMETLNKFSSINLSQLSSLLNTSASNPNIGTLSQIKLPLSINRLKDCKDILFNLEPSKREEFEEGWLKLILKHTKSKPRILITAPSNGAVDLIVERVMKESFFDGTGGNYKPSIVRLGVMTSVNKYVKEVSLDQIYKNDLLLNSTREDQLNKFKELSNKISEFINNAFIYQFILWKLMETFTKFNNPIPEKWEIRVNIESGEPYWVDHSECKTTLYPPPPHLIQLAIEKQRFAYKSYTELPEYNFYSFNLTRILNKIESLELRRKRLKYFIDYSHNSNSSKNKNENYYLPMYLRERIESSIIQESNLVFTTLNSAGNSTLDDSEFCVTVVDEAAQCVEPNVLIALRRGCKQCIMVGDQKQLSATVICENIKKFNYDRSLFERLIQGGHSYYLLNTQYRMTPIISSFPSREFYQNRLKNGKNVMDPIFLPPFMQRDPFSDIEKKTEEKSEKLTDLVPFLPSLFFIDLETSKDSKGSNKSLINSDEAKVTLALTRLLIDQSNKFNYPLGSLGIITPYSDQLQLLKSFSSRESFMKEYIQQPTAPGSNVPQLSIPKYDIELNTVDAFQGREKNFVIMSTVRSNTTNSIGFLADIRRMNVAITRAKYGLYIIGNSRTLNSNPIWRKLIGFARKNKMYTCISDPNADLKNAIMNPVLTRVPKSLPNTNYNPQFSHLQYNNPQYNNPQFNNPQYINSQYNNPQYNNPQYSNPNYQKLQNKNFKHNNPHYKNSQKNNKKYKNNPANINSQLNHLQQNLYSKFGTVTPSNPSQIPPPPPGLPQYLSQNQVQDPLTSVKDGSNFGQYPKNLKYPQDNLYNKFTLPNDNISNTNDYKRKTGVQVLASYEPQSSKFPRLSNKEEVIYTPAASLSIQDKNNEKSFSKIEDNRISERAKVDYQTFIVSSDDKPSNDSNPDKLASLMIRYSNEDVEEGEIS